MRTPGPAGYTLIEIIVAIVIFTAGALALAASSAVVAEAMAANALRERGRRIASSRIAVIKTQCAVAMSGGETVQQIQSAWSVAHPSPSRVDVVESVGYLLPRGSRAETYRATVWCPK